MFAQSLLVHPLIMKCVSRGPSRPFADAERIILALCLCLNRSKSLEPGSSSKSLKPKRVEAVKSTLIPMTLE